VRRVEWTGPCRRWWRGGACACRQPSPPEARSSRSRRLPSATPLRKSSSTGAAASPPPPPVTGGPDLSLAHRHRPLRCGPLRRFTPRTDHVTAPNDDFHRLWTPHAVSHPSTFNTLAIDPTLHNEVRADLLRFLPQRSQNAMRSKEDGAGGRGTGGRGTGLGGGMGGGRANGQGWGDGF
jgi:hypothetical protein